MSRWSDHWERVRYDERHGIIPTGGEWVLAMPFILMVLIGVVYCWVCR